MTQAYIYAQYLMQDVRNYLLTPKKGQGMIEYALLAALISIVAIAVLIALGPQITARFQAVDNAI